MARKGTLLLIIAVLQAFSQVAFGQIIEARAWIEGMA
jgi:hypothetical protein